MARRSQGLVNRWLTFHPAHRYPHIVAILPISRSATSATTFHNSRCEKAMRRAVQIRRKDSCRWGKLKTYLHVNVLLSTSLLHFARECLLTVLRARETSGVEKSTPEHGKANHREFCVEKPRTNFRLAFIHFTTFHYFFAMKKTFLPWRTELLLEKCSGTADQCGITIDTNFLLRRTYSHGKGGKNVRCVEIDVEAFKKNRRQASETFQISSWIYVTRNRSYRIFLPRRVIFLHLFPFASSTYRHYRGYLSTNAN